MLKEEIIAKLTDLKIQFDPSSSKSELMALLDSVSAAVPDKANGEIRASGIAVRDPEDFRPKVLPLIITFPAGYTPSKEQVRLAKVFNGFAYQFPDQWKARKEDLLKQLEDAKNAPDPVENPDIRLSVGPKPPVNVL